MNDSDREDNKQPPTAVMRFMFPGFSMPAESKSFSVSNKGSSSIPIQRVASGSAEVVASGHSGSANPAPMAGRYGAIHNEIVRAAAPGREAPKAVNDAVQPGDVAYFSGNHAEMCVGFDEQHRALWCSDTYQGTHFFADQACQQGTYEIFRCNDPNFKPEQAIKAAMDKANPTYTHWCAKYTANALESGGAKLNARAGRAKDYLEGNYLGSKFTPVQVADVGSLAKPSTKSPSNSV